MAAETKPMICPSCGVEMNRHAEKLVWPTAPADRALVDPLLGGILEELHTCPACGTGGSRRGHGKARPRPSGSRKREP